MGITEILDKLKPFIAISILIILLLLSTLLYQENNLKKEIAENCGWSDKNYRCTCEYGEVIKMENLINGGIDLKNVSMDWEYHK